MANSLKTTAYEAIRSRMIAGPLGPGSHLSELALARELGISRTPVRDAIGRLINEGVVEQVPNAGAFVRKPTRVDLEDLFELRQWVEAGAAAVAAQRISPRQIEQLEKAVAESRAIADGLRRSGRKRVDSSTARQRAMAETLFHMTLVRASGNARAIAILSTQHLLSQIWGYLPEQEDLYELAWIYRDHARILRAVRRGDGETAGRCMVAHIRKGRDDMLAKYDLHQRRLALGEADEETWPESLLKEIRGLERVDTGLKPE